MLCILILFIKLIPLWILRKTKYELKQVIYVFVFLLLYTIWLHINGETLYSFFTKAYNKIKNNRSFGPIIPFISNIFKNFH